RGVRRLRSVEPELDGVEAARGSGEGRECEAWVDRPDAGLDEVEDLTFGVCDAAERGSDLYGDAVGVDPCGVEAGVLEGESGGRDREVRVAVESPGGLRVHEPFGLEVVDLCGEA